MRHGFALHGTPFWLDGTPNGTPFCQYGTPNGHHFVPMGHKKGHHSAPMGHYFAMMGHQMRHQSAEMGHGGPPRDTILTSVGVMVKSKARRGGSTRVSGAERPKNQIWVAEADPTSFCILCRLWYTFTNKFSAQQGWRHGVRSRSLGGTLFNIKYQYHHLRTNLLGWFLLSVK
jgi:hypothetical protein